MQIVYIGNCLSRWGYTPTTIETLSERFREFCIVHPYSDQRNSLFRLTHMLWGIWRNRNNADLVLIDTYSSAAFYFGWLCSCLCRALKIPYVPFLHGGNLPSRLNESSGFFLRYFEKATWLVAPSNYLYQHFIAAGYRQTTIIPNFIDIQNYPYKQRFNPAPKILWVRSFHQTYNPNLAIDILLQVKKKYPSAELCMVGPDKDGSMKSFINYATNQGVIDAIKITGKLTKNEWIALSSYYDFFLNTTNYDNTPVSVMEAMALGMLVVSTNVGGVPAIVLHNETGYLYPCNNAEVGAAEIINCIESKQAENISSNARKQSESWDWQDVKIRWQHLFDQVKRTR